MARPVFCSIVSKKQPVWSAKEFFEIIGITY
jgi:hypothetical protein